MMAATPGRGSSQPGNGCFSKGASAARRMAGIDPPRPQESLRSSWGLMGIFTYCPGTNGGGAGGGEMTMVLGTISGAGGALCRSRVP
jgi:hypothetical protein